MNIYTDGSCLGNPGRGGWAFIVTIDGQKIQEKTGTSQKTTNNIMELTAIDEALKYICGTEGVREVNIYTDSNYAKQGITNWSKKWKVNGWKSSTGAPVKNVELWKSIVEGEDVIKRSGICVQWFWVKAHSTNTFNNMVDVLAREQAEKLLKEN